jgi:ribosomal protein S6--L-glutamate ligase
MAFTRSLLRTRGQSPVTVGVLVESRYLTQDQPAGLVRALRAAGVDVRRFVIEDTSIDLCDGSWCDGLDVVAARGRSDALLAALRSAESAGVPAVNSCAAVRAVLDKAGMAAALAAAGIPTPASWLGHPRRLAERAQMPFPLVLKPMTGDNARGLRVVRTRSELDAQVWPEPVALAQEFLRGDGHDIKLYVAGEAVWAVRRPSPVDEDGAARAATDSGRRFAATRGLRTLGRACARLFGLSLCGVDCVLGPSGPLVVEVNDFPNYRGLGRSVDQDLARVVLAQRRAAARRALRAAPG